MDILTNVEVEKVFKGKSGEGQYGPYQIWNFNLKGDDRRFSMFEKEESPIPVVGMKIAAMKFEVKQTAGMGKHQGKTFTNYNITELIEVGDVILDPQSGKQPAPKGTLSTDIGPVSMYVSYYKDILCCLINNFGSDRAIEHYDSLLGLAQEGLERGIQAGLRVTEGDIKHKPNTDPVEIPIIDADPKYSPAVPADPFGDEM